ncbi:unnamed protein product [Brassica oleracea]
MWIVLLRLKEEGEKDVNLGQSVYEIYNHNVEVRVSKAGVNLLLLTWMKEFERIFYGNVYDPALLPDAKPNDLGGKASIKLYALNLAKITNIFSDDGATTPDEPDFKAKGMSFQVGSLSLTESIFSGNFFFNPLENKASMT